MLDTRLFRGAATAALTAIAATLALAGPMAGTALATKPTLAPAPTITSGPGSPIADQAVSFAWTKTTTASEKFWCAVDGASYVQCTSPWSYAPTSGIASGPHQFVLKARLASGPSRATTVPWPWTEDVTPPQAPSVDQPATPTRNTSASIGFGDGDPTATSFLCAVDDPAATTSCAQPTFNIAGPLAEGSHTVYVWALDSLLNKSAATTRTWTIDLTAPTSSPVFDSTPANPTSATSATFTWHDSDPDASSYVCSLDGAAQSPCTSGVSYAGLAGGTQPHTFSVWAVDTVGNVGKTPATTGWVVDTTAPAQPDIFHAPSNPTDQLWADFGFSDADATATFQCSLDGAAFSSCSSPSNYPSLSLGGHQFQVQAVDAVGNRSGVTTYQWTVADATVVPVSPIEFISGPNAYSNNTSPSFTWMSLDDTTTGFDCQLDGSPVSCTFDSTTLNGSATLSVTGDRTHVFAVKATDGTSWSPAQSYAWTLDTTAPVAPTFSSAPDQLTSSTSALFAYASEANAQFSCHLDLAADTLCGSISSFNALTPGSHTFSVTATDSAGNATTSSYQWTIDTSAPDAPSVVTPSGYVANADSVVSWSDADPNVVTGSTVCTLDGTDPVSPCPAATPVDLGALKDGPHSFSVTVVNGTGKTAESTRSWTVDTTKPLLSVSGLPGSLTNQTLVTVTATETEIHPDTLTCVLSGPNTLISTCGTYAGLVEGDYTLTVGATDLAGNVADPFVANWTVDTTPPVLTVTGIPSGFTSSTSSTPDISQSDSHPDSSAIACSLAGPTSVAGCGPYVGLTDGSYTLTVGTSDLAGNAASPVVKAWTVDTTAPVLSVTNLPSGTTSATSISPVVSQTDANPGPISCSLTGPTSATGCGPQSNLPDGDYTFTATTTDLAGNVATRAVSSWTVKRLVTAPVAGPVDPAPTASLSTPTTLTGVATATFSETVHALTANGASIVLTGTSTVVPTNVACLSGTATVACSGSFTAVRLTPRAPFTPGQHYTVQVIAGAAQDSAGNPSVANSSAFRGSLTEQENSAAARATWATVRATAAYGHSFVRQSLAGASATYAFKGTNVTWWTVTGKDQGKATVYIDGVRKAYVDNYAAATHFKVARRYTRLGNRTHTLRIVVRGLKGAKAGTGTFVTVDAFSVGKTRANTPALVMTWRSAVNRHYSAGHAAVARFKNETFSFTFRGTAVSWFTQRGVNQGRVAVYVDGVRKAVVDNYAARTVFGVRRSVTRLADKVHTLKLVVLGTHHKGATGTWVTVDRFTVT